MLALMTAGTMYPAPVAITKADFEISRGQMLIPLAGNVQSTTPMTDMTVSPQPVKEELSPFPKKELNEIKKTRRVTETKLMWITAYSSTPEETDDTPFITASGSHVRDGIVATNMLPMGSKIKIPALYGDKIFVVEDRMHQRMVNKVDIWMPEKSQAIRFGIKHTEVVVLADSIAEN